MSTYFETGKNPDHEVIFGWDSSLNTYFLHVIDKSTEEDDENHDVLWIGCTLNEILDLETLKGQAEPYTEISPEVWTELYADANG